MRATAANRRRPSGEDCLALAVLAGATVSLFWLHLIGDATFVGDSDRLSQHLTALQNLVEGLRHGSIPTWNEAFFGGYSLVNIPFLFPDPLAISLLLWPDRELIHAAAFLTMVLLFAGGASAYLFVRSLTREPFTAFVGAAAYEFSIPVILRASTLDTTLLTFILAPIFLFALGRARAGSLRPAFLLAAISLAVLLALGFIQEIAYALLLAGLYSLYLAVIRRDWRPIGVGAAAVIVAFITTLPRMIGIASEFFNSVRHYTGQPADTFAANYTANKVYASEILRWFDDRIFGLTIPELDIHNQFAHLHEGLVLYSSAFASLLIVFGAVRHAPALLRARRLRGESAPVLLFFLVFAMWVALTRVGYWFMYHLFLGFNLFHARVVPVAAICQAALAAIFLYHLAGGDIIRRPRFPRPAAFVFCAALATLLVLAIEHIARTMHGFTPVAVTSAFGPQISLADGAAFRVLASLAVLAAILIGIFCFRRNRPVRGASAAVLGFLMVGQAYVFALEEMAGPQMRTERPFHEQVRLLARRDEFLWPSAAAQHAMQAMLETDRFRTAIVCDRKVFKAPCAPFIANFWQLRMIDGYLNEIPARLAALPWDGAMGLREIDFWTASSLPWALLGLCNVKYAIVVSSSLIMNAVRDADGTAREVRPADVTVLTNPFPVTPRAFFARTVQPAASLEAAVSMLFPGGQIAARGHDVESRSYVEGYSAAEEFDDRGVINATYDAGRAHVEVSPSAHARFLVLNERYDSSWHAFANGAELPIYPTNVFMRGLVVPPGVQSITLCYRPFVTTPLAAAISGGGLVLLVLCATFAGRLDRRYRFR